MSTSSGTGRKQVPAAVHDGEELEALRREYNEFREYHRALLDRQAEEIRQMAYAISHDLREPLRMINSYTQLLETRYSSAIDEDGREFMQQVLTATQRMDRLLTDLLTYSQLFTPTNRAVSEIDSEAVLTSVLLSLGKDIQSSGAEVTHDPLPSLHFDFNHLSLLFRQLMSNSIKFHGEKPPCIHISAETRDQEVEIAFRDTGIGIDPRYHEQVFGLFRRLHGRDEYPGTGTGLALCKRIVEQAGGKIWVESQAGSGATFRFTIPN